jgi:hypothetical protein
VGQRLELTGRRFGRLVVIRYHNSERGHSYWLCVCDCGVRRVVRGNTLNQPNRTKSCGCLAREKTAIRSFKHGARRSGKTTCEYDTWKSMVRRCTNPNFKRWADYGGRGITVCKRWRHSFPNFLNDIGERPPGMSLDRRDNDGNYTKRNCRWATPKMQRANQRPRRPRRPIAPDRLLFLRAIRRFKETSSMTGKILRGHAGLSRFSREPDRSGERSGQRVALPSAFWVLSPFKSPEAIAEVYSEISRSLAPRLNA